MAVISDILNREFIRARVEELVVANDTDEETRTVLEEAWQQEPEEHLLSHGSIGGRRTLTGEQHRASPAILLDETSFFSRDPVMSNLQSALEEYYEDKEPNLVQEEAGSGRRVLVATDPTTTRRAFAKFEITNPLWLSDPGWVSSKVAEGLRLLRGKHRFKEKPAPPVELRNDARLVLVGDWATGLKRAQDVAWEMGKVLKEGKAQGRDQHVINLGDTYYSGWQREYEKRFLPYWPVQLGEANEKIGSWACNGNHDMYSGGHAYFDCLLADERFGRQEQSSYFSLENDNWQILGLDTAWEDHNLKDPQASWVAQKLEDYPERNTMLLSHHQLFSAYEGGERELEDKLRSVLDTNRIDAWFWGHEHRCVLYKPYKGVRFGRCIGHGGVPVYRDRVSLPEPASYQYREYFDAGWEQWALCGFAVLDFNGPTIQARYIDEFGRTHKEETIE